ncbi:MAG: N-methyl-D-aspartate receptor NMDAR2C subunit [bacterium]|nr:N-methyl-D-aspartate receptor NMDAR2C subunit [bacterium]
MMQNKNEVRWFLLWQRLGARGDGREPYEDLVRRYAEPHRRYHVMAHIEHCLDEFEAVRHLAINPEIAEMALWYHDAVYRTELGVKDNEEKSARLARAVLHDASLPFIGEYVARLILATKHKGVPEGPDARLVVDIDLSSLGLSQDEFYRNWDLIREEYDWVPDEIFLAKRLEILGAFLKRSAIYYTQFFHNKYEAQAQRNIEHARIRFSRGT